MAGLTLTGKPLLICEGAEDEALVRAFIEHRGLQQFDVDVIGNHGSAHGITALRFHLPLVVGLPNFHAVQHIVLLADTDDSYTSAMSTIRNEIITANKDPRSKHLFPIPRSAHKKWKKGNLTFTVILQPGDIDPGCLETAIWNILTRLHGAKAQCIEAAIGCSGINAGPNKWSNSKLDKARVRAGVAMLLKSNPALALSKMWTRTKGRALVPLNSPEFDVVFQHLSAV